MNKNLRILNYVLWKALLEDSDYMALYSTVTDSGEPVPPITPFCMILYRVGWKSDWQQYNYWQQEVLEQIVNFNVYLFSVF